MVRGSRASPTSRWAGGREPRLSTVLFWRVTQYLMNIVIFKWVLANSDEYHLLKWVLVTPLSQSSVSKIHTWQALSGCEQSTWNTAIWLEPVEFHRQNKTVHKLGSRPPSVQRWGRRRPSRYGGGASGRALCHKRTLLRGTMAWEWHELRGSLASTIPHFSRWEIYCAYNAS